MTNDQCLMTKDDKTPNAKRGIALLSSFEHSGFFVIRHSCLVIPFVRLFRGLKFQTVDVVDVRCLSRPVERDEDGQAHGNFGRCNCDDEEDEHLCVVIR